MSSLQRMFAGRSAKLLFALGLVALAILLSLGTWQVQRLAWKDDLIATITARVASAPEPLAQIEQKFAQDGDVEYWPVTVEGVFHHEGERHFFATHDGRSGYYIYTPLQLDDGRLLLLNRGFVPFDFKDAALRAAGQVEGRQTIVGLARNPLAGKPSWVVPDNDIQRNVFYWKDINAMASTSGVGRREDYLGFFVDANDAPNPGGLPIGGVTLISMPNNHMQYVVTWYGLAAALVGVMGAWFWRRRKP